MGWGDSFAEACNTATETAKAAADALANSAQGALDRAAAIAAEERAALGGLIDNAISGLTELVEQGVEAIDKAFTPGTAGGGLQPCPHATPAQVEPPVPVPVPVPDIPPPVPDVPVPVEDYNIVSVEWLNGDDVTTIGACEQFVNLPRDAKWLIGSDIANIDRLGIKPRFLVTFDRPCSAGYQWRIVPLGGDAPDYTATEEARNADFVPGNKEWTTGQVTDGKQIVADGAKLVAGGGYTFKIEAKDDKNKVVSSGIITTKRLFWFVELPMTGLASVLGSTAGVEGEFANHHMMLKKLPDLSIAHQENIGTDADSDTMGDHVAAAVAGNATATAKAPYLLRISYTDHLAVQNPARPQRVDGVPVGPAAAVVTIPISSVGLRAGDGEAPRSLWRDIVAGESWFVSAEYTPNAGGAAVAILVGQVTPDAAAGSSRSIDVDVSGLPAGTGSITVTVNVVDRMRGGLAIGGAADICVCTRSWWTTSSDAKQACTVLHEMGHKVQAVVAGITNQPDRAATQYDNAGHVGSHCHNGCAGGQANFNTTANISASTCVMFGTVNTKLVFCGNCGPAAKKVDIGSGF